jgi:hypothetical protein
MELSRSGLYYDSGGDSLHWRLERDIIIRIDAGRRMRDQQPGNPSSSIDP